MISPVSIFGGEERKQKSEFFLISEQSLKYSGRAEELECLAKRVEKLRDLVKKTCEAKIERLKRELPKTEH